VSKHDVLTEAEMAGYSLDPAVAADIDALRRSRPDGRPFRVLDWGCGRGRAVAHLISMGVEAHGVDVDEVVMKRGYGLFAGRGIDPSSVLVTPEETKRFPDGTFDYVFSEETIEHVTALDYLARETYRLMAPAALARHSYPASKRFMEPHVKIPLVHWTRNRFLRTLGIATGIAAGAGPSGTWPETEGQPFWTQVRIYSDYLERKTCYRDLNDVAAEFERAGFEATWECRTPSASGRLAGLIRGSLRRNGFPDGQVTMRLRKPSNPLSDTPCAESLAS
jgi:SAM-dependent methyltransferase